MSDADVSRDLRGCLDVCALILLARLGFLVPFECDTDSEQCGQIKTTEAEVRR